MIIYPLGTFYIISSFNFYEFRALILKYFKYLVLFSIIIQLLYYFKIIGVTTIYLNGEIRKFSLYFFNTEWGENRLSSIYWEPGQFQIIIIFILCLFTDELSKLYNIKYNFKKFGILLVALIMTQSTTGYFAFICIIIGVLSNVDLRRYKLFIPIALFLSITCIHMLWSSDTIQEKLAQKDETNKITSYSIRFVDNVSLLETTLAYPLTGTGMETKTYENRFADNDYFTASNGWLNMSAQNGIPFLIFIIYCIISNIKFICKMPCRIFIVLALIISQANETATFYPYLYMYVFRYKNYYKLPS